MGASRLRGEGDNRGLLWAGCFRAVLPPAWAFLSKLAVLPLLKKPGIFHAEVKRF